MAYLVGLLTAKEEAELRRRGWDIEDAPTEDFDTGGRALGSQRMRMVWVDQDIFKIMEGPDWDEGGRKQI
jgi:hypothetical protein